MRRSALALSLALSIVYLVIAVLITTAASFKGMCGDGDFRPSCGMFVFGIALYGAIAIGASTTFLTLAAVVFRRRASQLLKIGSLLYTGALLSFVLPVMAADNKFAGAIVALAVFPLSLILLAAASMCFVLWVGRWVQTRFPTPRI
jgi:hypothetical protein